MDAKERDLERTQGLDGEDASSKPASPGRRSFLGVLLGIGTASVGVLLSVPLVRFALHPVLGNTTETSLSDLGTVDEFSSITSPVKRLITIEQRDGWRKTVSQKSVYLTRDADGQLRVLSSICPHLGCSIPWSEVKGQFICPCHVGVFASDGSLISGPPPRAMDELKTTVENGRLKVRYQYFRQLVHSKEVIA
ncbi:MAG: ubiquinol-cytochrome c reductase iron-sulfur subunit [Acidobacteriota bacterium]